MKKFLLGQKRDTPKNKTIQVYILSEFASLKKQNIRHFPSFLKQGNILI